MEILDLVGGKPGRNGLLDNRTDFMNLRKLQPSEGLTEKLLSVQADHSAIDNLIRGLVDLLPKRDGIWSLDDRANGCAWQPAFLTLAIRRVMVNTGRSLLRWSNHEAHRPPLS
jgi:hypothetical protein